METGIAGPVRVIAKETLSQKFGFKKFIVEDIVMELNHSKWTYKSGLNGEHQLHLQDPQLSGERKWHVGRLPTNRQFVWYKVL